MILELHDGQWLRIASAAAGHEIAKCVTPRQLATTGAVADARS